MSSYQAIKINHKKHWDDFFYLPKIIYDNDTIQTIELRLQIEEELNPNKNPIAKECVHQGILVYKNNEIAARAIAIINQDLNRKMGKAIGLLGYIEFIEDSIALKLLLETCSNWLERKGCTLVWTDARFSLNYQVGIQNEGFDRSHTFLMPRQPSYYCKTLENLGFKCIKDLHAYGIKLNPQYVIPTDITSQANSLLEQEFKVRTMRKADVWPCLNHYNEHWKNNFAHTPFSQSELDHLNRSMSLFLDTRFCFMVEKDKQLVGYLFTFPDYNLHLKEWKGKLSILNIFKFLWTYKIKKNVKGLKTAIIGVDNEYAGRKISSLLNYALLNQALKYSCSHIERSWILEDNTASIKQAKRMGGQLIKKYGIYEAPLKTMQNFDFRKVS